MQQNHNCLADGPDGCAFTLLATPIAETHVGAKAKNSNQSKTILPSFIKPSSSRMSKRVPKRTSEDRPFAVTTVFQLYAGEHGTTRLNVVCRIDEGIKDAEEAKSGAC